MTDYLIIGNGVAGTTAAENIRKTKNGQGRTKATVGNYEIIVHKLPCFRP